MGWSHCCEQVGQNSSAHIKSVSSLCCSSLSKPTTRRTKAHVQGPSCAGYASRRVNGAGKCGAEPRMLTPRLMPFPLYLLSWALSYPPSSAQMLLFLWNLSYPCHCNQSFSPQEEEYSTINSFLHYRSSVSLAYINIRITRTASIAGLYSPRAETVSWQFQHFFHTLTIHVGCIKLIKHPVRKTDTLSLSFFFFFCLLLITLTEV